MITSKWLRFALTALLAVGLLVVTPTAASAASPADPCTGSLAGQSLCDAAGTTPSAGGAVVQAVVGVVSFISDPLGYIAAALSGAATWLMEQVSLFANNATAPDLTASWWIDAYQKAMAVAMLLFCLLLAYELVLWGTGKVTPRQMGETFQLWIPAFLGGIIFGPALAQFLINGSTALADGIIRSMTGFGGGDAFKAITDAVGNAGGGAGAAQGAGQAVIAIVEAVGVLIAAVVVFVVLCLQAVIVYLVGGFFPIVWVWIIAHRHREHAWKAPVVLATLVFGKAVLFFAVGIAMAVATSAVAISGAGAGADFALIVMAVIALLLAAFSPLWLTKLLAVAPGGGSHADSAGSAAGAAARTAGRTGHGGTKATKAGGSLAALAAKSRQGGTGGGNIVGGASKGWTKTPPPPSSTSKAASMNTRAASSATATPASGTPTMDSQAPPSGKGGVTSSTTSRNNGTASSTTTGTTSGDTRSGTNGAERMAAPPPRRPGSIGAVPTPKVGRPSGPKPKPTVSAAPVDELVGASKLGTRAAVRSRVPTSPTTTAGLSQPEGRTT